MKITPAALCFLFVATFSVLTVTAYALEKPDGYHLDPSPYNPEKDLDPGMFVSHWNESAPRIEHGALVVRDVFTPNTTGDPFRPAKRGAVLKNLVAVSYGMLDAGMSTTPDTLDGQQKVFYTLSGEGTVTAGGKTADLRTGVGFLMPAGLEFVISNTSDEPLTFYIPTEPVTSGFIPRKDILVKDLNPGFYEGTHGHWTNMTKRLFSRDDGLCCITHMASVWLAPMQMAQPHAAMAKYIDVVWFAISGGIKTQLGKQLRDLPAGSGFVNPGDGRYYHANINTSADEYINLFWLRASDPEEKKTAEYADDIKKYYQLDPKPYDPEIDLAPEMFLSHWKESPPRIEHGNMVIRDIFTPNTSGDPFRPSARGAVLKQLVSVSYGMLDAGMKTVPDVLDGVQKVFYVISGTGRVTGGKKTADIKPGSCIFIPEGLKFSFENTGDMPLTMYIPCEPVPDGFTPRKDMAVLYEGELPMKGPGHWTNFDVNFFGKKDGLAYIMGMHAVRVAPMTVPEMHPTWAPENDVVWFAVSGNIYSMLGKQLFHLEPGSAYVNPGDNRFNHGNINVNKDHFIKMIWVRTSNPE